MSTSSPFVMRSEPEYSTLKPSSYSHLIYTTSYHINILTHRKMIFNITTGSFASDFMVFLAFKVESPTEESGHAGVKHQVLPEWVEHDNVWNTRTVFWLLP